MQDYIDVEVLTDDDQFIPHYASSSAAGCDAKACISEDLIINPGERALVPTGLKVSIPDGFEIQVRPRSGFALKHGLTVLNTPGTIDADYRGEIGVILMNHGTEAFTITRGMRIAQLVVSKVYQARFHQKETLTTTMRGEGGFGHSGTH